MSPELDDLQRAITTHLTAGTITRAVHVGDSITIDILAVGGLGSLRKVEEQVLAGIEEVRAADNLKSSIHVNAQTTYAPK